MGRKSTLCILIIVFLTISLGSAIASDSTNYAGPPEEIRLSVHVPSTHLIWNGADPFQIKE